MSAPESMTIQDISGSWTTSKTLSDDNDAILAAQGIGYLIRKGMQMCSFTLNMVHNSTASPPTLAVTAVPSGGYFKGATEMKTLDGKPVERKDFVLGSVAIKLEALTSTEELEDAYLRDGWVGEGGLSEIIVNEKAGWTNDGVWGFVAVNGDKYLAKKSVLTTKKGEIEKCRMILEYKPLV